MNLRFGNAAEMVAAIDPADPVTCLRLHEVRAAAQTFLAQFPERVLYAVKCNPTPAVMRALYEGGIRHFDTASIAEIKLIHDLFPDAHSYFMHPIKNRRSIVAAYHQYGIRCFALDTPEELEKILEETGADPEELTLMVRLGLPESIAVVSLQGKFGCSTAEAARLLRRAASMGCKVGITFHVGSQCLHPSAYTQALAQVGETLALSGVTPSIIDAGGGFPSAYVGMQPLPLSDFTNAIHAGMAALNLPSDCVIACEPGRALVAPGASVVTRVEMRRGDELYLNDGLYGALSDLRFKEFEYPTRVLRRHGTVAETTSLFTLWGPTCDAFDTIGRPYPLPVDIQEGDFIEFGQLGAYSATMGTDFNGFAHHLTVDVEDAALLPEIERVMPRRRRLASVA